MVKSGLGVRSKIHEDAKSQTFLWFGHDILVMVLLGHR